MNPDRWSEVENLYHAALEREPSERGVFLGQCPDEEVRKEVQSLLDHERSGDELMENPRWRPNLSGPSLAAGTRLGPYEILELIGAGGMGEVYRAFDTQLRREVALKVLPPERLADPESKQRLLREARAASALNHPNIVTVHEIDSEGGVDFIAMEFIEGKSLKELIPAKGLPLGKTLDYAVQIANGLAKAHAAGIIHRDLKPGNIMVTSDGLVKLMDFGLARRMQRAESETATLTVEGEIAGTPAYMSPEQARGEEVDARTDLFSFGAVLYEMTTGHPAFSGTTSALIFDAILHRTPASPIGLNSQCPTELERVINKALDKHRETRYQSTQDLLADLRCVKRDKESALSAESNADREGVVGKPTRQRRRVAIAFAGLLAVAAAGVSIARFVTVRPPRPSPGLRERRLTANPSENAVNEGVISPDGKYLAYSDQMGMHLKLLETGETRDILQPQGPSPLHAVWWPNEWFPDGTGFVAAGTEVGAPTSAWVISALGGSPRKLRDDADAWSISPDGTLIAFGTGAAFARSREIWLMGAHGEEPRRFVSGSEDDAFFWAAWSPDGQRIAYGRYHRTPDKLECSIETRDLQGNRQSVILSDPRLCDLDIKFLWFPGGRFLFTMLEPEMLGRYTSLWEISVDTKTGEPVGKPGRITSWAEFMVDHLSVTSDRKKLAITRAGSQGHVYVGELDSSGLRLKNARRLTLNENADYPNQWMPDSKTVLFRSNRNGHWEIFKQALDEAAAEPVVTGPDYKDWPVVSPDGSWILYLSQTSRGFSPSGPSSRGYRAPATVRIMRVSASGGPPQLVLEGKGIDYLACARSPAALCVFSEETGDRKQLIFTEFSPDKGMGRELTRVDLKQPVTTYGWDLSPDGLYLAVAQYAKREGCIRILPLAGGQAREVNVQGWSGLSPLYWAPDGKALFVTADGAAPPGDLLLHVDLKGSAQVVWQHKGITGFNYEGIRGIPSPNGRHLALLGFTNDSNVWMLENF